MSLGDKSQKYLQKRVEELESELREARKRTADVVQRLNDIRLATRMPELYLDESLDITGYSTSFAALTHTISERAARRENLGNLLEDKDFRKLRVYLERRQRIEDSIQGEEEDWDLQYKGPGPADAVGKSWIANRESGGGNWAIEQRAGKWQIFHTPHICDEVDCYLMSAAEYGDAQHDLKVCYTIRTSPEPDNIRDLSLVISGAPGEVPELPDAVGYTVSTGSKANTEANIQKNCAGMVTMDESLRPDTEYRVEVERTGGRITRKLSDLTNGEQIGELSFVDTDAIYDLSNHVGFHTYSAEARFYDVEIYTRRSRYSIEQFRIPAEFEVKIDEPGLRERIFRLRISSTVMRGVRSYLLLFEDITSEKLGAEELDYHKELMWTILEKAPVMMSMTDSTGRHVWANRQWKKTLGYTFEDTQQEGYWRRIYPDEETRRRVMEQDPAGWGEFVSSTADGRSLHTRWIGVRLSDGSTIWIGEDMTAAIRAREERNRLVTAIEQAAESVTILDTDGRIVYANPAFEKLTGYSREEAVGRTGDFLKSGEHDEDFYSRIKDRIGAGEIWTRELVNERSDGTLFRGDASITPVRNEDGETVNYVTVMRDITHEKELEEQLISSQKMEAIGRLAGGLAHDYNNLLSVIMGYADIAISELDTDHPLYQDIHQILLASERARDITRQLLAFGRKQLLEVKVLNLNVLVGNLEKMLRRLIGEDIELVSFLETSLANIRVDPAQMEQVLMNLAINARDAMPEGGKLTLETGNVYLDEEYVAHHSEVEPGDYVMLAVSDNGSGMEEDVRARIFDPFFTTKEHGKGTGLGLSTVYGIVKQHGGSIWVYSEPGKGSTFKIYLPAVSEKASEQKAVRREKITRRGKETILVVEDDKLVRGLACDILRSRGYNIIESESPEHSLELARELGKDLDLLLTDVIMPGMSGKELYTRLSEFNGELRVLYMSGYTDNVIAHHGVLEEGVDFLKKPFTVKALSDKVRDVLDR